LIESLPSTDFLADLMKVVDLNERKRILIIRVSFLRESNIIESQCG